MSREHSTQPVLIFFVGRAGYFLSHRLPTARAAIAQGYEVHVIAAESSLEDAISAIGVQFHRRWFAQDKIPPLAILAGFLQLLIKSISLRARVVQVVGLRHTLIGLFASLFLPWTRFIFSINGLGFLFLDQRHRLIYQFARRMITSTFTIVATLRSIDITFQNEDDMNLFCGMTMLRRANIHLIRGSGVDVEHYSETPLPKGETIIFGVACRMIRMKGVEDIITATRALIDEGYPVALRLAGDVDDANPGGLKADEIEAVCRNGEIEWLGYLSDIAPFWKACHVALLGSHGGEGLPMSLLIPAAMQRPIICSDTNGNRDLVHDGVNGYLYPAGDIEALKDAMRQILQQDLAKMGIASRKLIHDRTMDAKSVHRQFMNLYAD
jgi:glycosyltransferase involved in cell wall biosynthesis